VRQLVGAELHPGRDDRPQNHGSQPAGPNNQSSGCSERDPHGKPGKQTGPDLADLGEQGFVLYRIELPGCGRHGLGRLMTYAQPAIRGAGCRLQP